MAQSLLKQSLSSNTDILFFDEVDFSTSSKSDTTISFSQLLFDQELQLESLEYKYGS